MATETAYAIELAIEDLKKADLLHSILLPDSDAMVSVPLDKLQSSTVDGAFLGAGLDSRNLSSSALFVALPGENVDGRDFAPNALKQGHWVLAGAISDGQDDPLVRASAAVGSGVLLSPNPELALAHLATCWRSRLACEVVAVTGTNGKTTTKDFIRAMLSASGKTQATLGNLNNHLGLPLTLLNLHKDTQYAVIEMGASAVGDIRFLAEITQPHVGLITNAAAAHLAHFGSLENIIEGKGELMASLPGNGSAVLNADSPGFDHWNRSAPCPVISWGTTCGDHTWSWQASKSNPCGHLKLDDDLWPVPLPGAHNAANLCAAILACRALGVDDETLREGLNGFTASEHRSRILSWEDRLVLDDSYNANPASMLAAVNSLAGLPGKGRNLALLGAMAELGPKSNQIHLETGEELRNSSLDILLAVGDRAHFLADGFEGQSDRETYKVAGHQEAFDWLVANSLPGDRIVIKGSRSSAMEKVLKKMGLK